ncbi:MAG: cytochrome c nitrite reductase pentaheme subunit [Vibrio sp.]
MKSSTFLVKLRGAGIALLLGLFFSSTLFAASSDESNVKTPDSTQQAKVEFVRDKNYACTQCHKDDKTVFKGEHAKQINPKTSRAIGCIDCHQNIGPEHRDGAKNVTKFSPGQVKAGTDKPAHDKAWIAKQNKQCVECHDGEQLRKAEWTHDVHVQKLTCASCHKIHPAKDPMQDIGHDSRVNKCVDCHSDQTQYQLQSKHAMPDVKVAKPQQEGGQ